MTKAAAFYRIAVRLLRGIRLALPRAMIHMALRSLRLWQSLVLVLLFATRAEAGSLTLAWDPSSGADVAGYMVAYGTQSRNYTTRIDASNATSYTIPSIANGVYYLAVQAYSSDGFMSSYSNEVIATIGDGSITVTIPTSCTSPDPFAAIGGGTCSNGGWLPPGMAVPGSESTQSPPPPPPPPSSVQGCQSPDPFAGMGGGTCYNGGWLPPGMPIPAGASTPATSTPTPPPSTPPPSSSPQGCATADPFAGMGGGTCYNGGWLPPGMPIPTGVSTPATSTPTPPPSTPPPSSSPQGCTSPDPFAGMGGGTCYNGGWLPPGMTPPGGTNQPVSSPSGATSPPASTGCITGDPFVSIGGGTCYKGGWVPAGLKVTISGTLRLVNLDDAWYIEGTDGIIYTSPYDLSSEQRVNGATVTLYGSTLPSLSGNDGVVIVAILQLEVR
jgi:hypothetical protein